MTVSAVFAFAARSGRTPVPSTSDALACAGSASMTTGGMHVVSVGSLAATHTGTPPSVAVTSYVPARGSVAVARCPLPGFRASRTRVAYAVTTSPAPARLEGAVLVNLTSSSTSSWSISATFPNASRKSKSSASSAPAANVVSAAVHAPSWSSAVGGAPSPPSVAYGSEPKPAHPRVPFAIASVAFATTWFTAAPPATVISYVDSPRWSSPSRTRILYRPASVLENQKYRSRRSASRVTSSGVGVGNTYTP